MRVAIIGAGRMGETHARAWADLAPQVEVAAVVGHHAAGGVPAAPAARATTDLGGVLADPAIGIVSICTPTDTHLALTARALAAGKHVLLEKPIARTVEEGERLVELGRLGPGLLMVAQVVRFFPGYVALRRLAEEGTLGTVGAVRAHRLAPTGGRPAWLDDERRSGGVLVDLAVHDLDQSLLLLGPARRVRAVHGPSGTAELTIEHDTGAVSTVTAGWDLPADRRFATLLEVTGDHGRATYSAVLEPGGTSELTMEQGGTTDRRVVDPGEPYTAQARYFLDRVRTGTPPLDGDPAASLAALRLALAARTALAGGSAVDLG